ncbi:sec24-related protein [Roridomyces roridus]|uniref:Sec24-related protein n=1 Tax=Roridomyces roridus TaxID=1738132 RepID=A0AAD7FS36_9AGAR|nr:sec24-related protein [Roridomyces roridus]
MNHKHIPQPPHSAGRSFQGFRRRIDPAQLPSPTELIEFDRHQWEDAQHQTLPGSHVPFSTSDFVSLDQGNSSPKFVRMTTWNIPYTSRLAKDCSIPLAAVFQPFADLDPREEPVPLVDLGPNHGPERCEGCRAYINPWCTWVRGGNAWKCNLCEHETEVSSAYFCNLDGNGRRLDHDQRPELTHGTVDFAVPSEYWAHTYPSTHHNAIFSPQEPPPTGTRQPLPMNFVEALHSGALHTACSALRDVLFGENACFPPQSEIAILTFDVTLHFYDLSSDLVPMLVLPDIDEVFLPLRSGLFVRPAERQAAIEGLLSALPERFENISYTDAALGSVVIASLAALAGRGGQVVVFQSIMPKIGPGALSGDAKEADLYDTSKETTLYAPRDNTWRDIGALCAEEGIGVSMFLTMSQYIDVGSIAQHADGAVLHSQLRRLVRRTTGYNCTMRVRSSNGIRISEYCGNFHPRGPTDLDFGVLDADKAVSVTLQVAGNLNVRAYAFLQSAVLYTTVDGLRRVRTFNLALPIVELAFNVFRLADLDTTVYHLAREAVTKMTSEKLANIRDDLTENCSAILLAYRNKCSNASSIDQLILPDAFRSLPIFTLAMTKSKCLRAARNVSSDVRNYYAHRMLSMSVRNPTTGRIVLPDIMRDSHLYMEGHGVYLIDNGETMVMWIGGSVSPQLLLDLFGVDDIMALDSQMNELPRLETHISAQDQRGGRIPKFHIARQNMDGAELEFSDMLVEDQNTGAMAYTDYLSFVHNQIKQVYREGGTLGGGVSLRGSIW